MARSAGLDAALPGGRRPQKLPPALERLVKLYEAWGMREQAAEWQAKLDALEAEAEP